MNSPCRLIPFFLITTLFINIRTTAQEQVKIGEQIWMKKNLNVEKFATGDIIPQAKSIEEWIEFNDSKTPAWSYYNFNPIHDDKFGKLYNSYAMLDWKSLCPVGWKIPSDEDFRIMKESLGPKAGRKLMSASGWNSFLVPIKCPNCLNWSEVYRSKIPCHKCKDNRVIGKKKILGGGTNTSCFSAHPGGILRPSEKNSSFSGIGESAVFWTNKESIYAEALLGAFVCGGLCYVTYNLNYNEDNFSEVFDSQRGGHSVRCIRGGDPPTVALEPTIDLKQPVIYSDSAIFKGEIFYTGGDTILAKGLKHDTSRISYFRIEYWLSDEDPENKAITAFPKSGLNGFKGVFSCNIKDLTPDKSYKAIAIANCPSGKVFSEEIEFKTKPADNYYYTEMGKRFFEAKRFARAAEAYQIPVDRGSKNNQDYFNLGNAFFFGEEYVKADTIFTRLLRIQPNSIMANIFKARCINHQKLDPDQSKGLAKPYYEKCTLLITPETLDKYKKQLLESYLYLGRYYAVQKDVPQAHSAWRKVLELDPENNKAKDGLLIE